MDAPTISIVVGMVWIIGTVPAIIFTDPFSEPHEIVWWPITLLKFLVRTLWQSLTTEWHP